jgi:hypothetical protein
VARPFRLLFFPLCLLALAFAAETPVRLTIGVLRADGLVIPFASYDGDWSTPWPVDLRNRTLPIALPDVDPKWWGAAGAAADWSAVLTDGVKRPLKNEALRQTHVFCTARLGVQTDYTGAPPSPDDPTVAKDGLAIAGNATLLPIERVPKGSADWNAATSVIAEKFNDAEKIAAENFTNWKHPYSAKQRSEYPIQIEAFYRSREQTKRGTWRISYVEAVRSFPARPEDKGCGLITYASGWIAEREGHDPHVELQARVTYCDRDGVSFMQPFGRLLLDDDVYWVYQMSSWRDEAYIVSRVRPEEIKPVAVVSGGDCPRKAHRGGPI